MQPHWEHFEHEADIGVRGMGSSAAEAFEQAALALTAVVVDPACVVPRESVALECEAPDLELLLCDWLNAVIYEMATRRMVFSHFEVAIDGQHLHGRATGEPVDVERHQPGVEIKGATYTALRVAADAQGNWLAQCVVDV